MNKQPGRWVDDAIAFTLGAVVMLSVIGMAKKTGLIEFRVMSNGGLEYSQVEAEDPEMTAPFLVGSNAMVATMDPNIAVVDPTTRDDLSVPVHLDRIDDSMREETHGAQDEWYTLNSMLGECSVSESPDDVIDNLYPLFGEVKPKDVYQNGVVVETEIPIFGIFVTHYRGIDRCQRVADAQREAHQEMTHAAESRYR